MDIALDHVDYDYPGGIKVLDGVDLTIGAGESVAIIGANGSGKTTLVRHLNGLLRPTRGRVLIDGGDAIGRHVAELARVVGLCFQDPDRQIFSGDVRAEVEFGLRQLGVPEEDRTARIKAALEAVALDDAMGRHPHDLGEARRKLLTIASVLAMETPIVVLDEPTVGLDIRGVERIAGIVGGLRDAGRTVLVISHDMRLVAESFERVVLLDAGRIVIDGPPREVYAEPAWTVLRAAGLEPPRAAVMGAEMGLGSTPTERSLLAAAKGRRGRTAPETGRPDGA